MQNFTQTGESHRGGRKLGIMGHISHTKIKTILWEWPMSMEQSFPCPCKMNGTLKNLKVCTPVSFWRWVWQILQSHWRRKEMTSRRTGPRNAFFLKSEILISYDNDFRIHLKINTTHTLWLVAIFKTPWWLWLSFWEPSHSCCISFTFGISWIIFS